MSRFIIAVILCLLTPQVALAEKRVALVIGNSAYLHTPLPTNPANDATGMAAALKARGFEVIVGLDLDKVAFDRKIREFAITLTTRHGAAGEYQSDFSRCLPG
jgi:Caspase domain